MSTELSIVRDVTRLREWVRACRSHDASVALVPTMGALHAGHISLVELARRHAARVLVSIFVNPTQFAAHEDLDRYPQTFDQDCAMLAKAGVDLVYAPTAREMYPEGSVTTVAPGGPALAGLEDAFRPHFFPAVATVVAKLLNQSGADLAPFGEKDYQQLLVVRRMVRDLDLPVRILAAPTLREPDGLAMSSRNRYLSPEERRVAAVLPAVLAETASGLRKAFEQRDDILDRGRQRLAEAGFAIDYLELRDGLSLAPLAGPVAEMRVLGSVRLGKTRLIDNTPV